MLASRILFYSVNFLIVLFNSAKKKRSGFLKFLAEGRFVLGELKFYQCQEY